MAVVPPISMSTTFKQDAPADFKMYEYGRSGNPTRDVLEKCIASLDGAKHACVFSSGLATSTTITHLLNAGDHVITGDDVYGGTNRYFRKVVSRMNIETTFVDATDAANIEAAIRPNTKMVWVETPTNPTLKVTDLAAISKVGHDHGAIVVVDNTFATPALQRPLEHGADIVMHSITKYLGGHSDVVGGALVAKDPDLVERIRFLQNSVGSILGPFDAYLGLRGVKTLAIRMQRHCESSLKIASWLESHPKVERVVYPGLPSHPQYEVASRQMRLDGKHAGGGMITMYLAGGLDESRRMLENVRMFTLAESLGGVESLIEHPAIMTHASVPAEQRATLGISDGLIRLSVGIEHPDDLMADLERGLEAV